MHDIDTRPTRRGWVLALTALGSFMVALDTLVVSTALSTIRRDLGASLPALEWTVNAYNLSFAVLLLTAAALGDRFGRRRFFALGLGIFAAASAACALAPGVGLLIAARAVQGAGAALVMPIGLALLAAAFPPEKRGAALGLLGGITGLAVAAGPLVGGAVVEGIDWPWIFWLNVPLGVAAIPLVLRMVPESRGPGARLDVGGLALVTAGALGVVWGLVRANAAGWGSAEVLGALGAGAVLLAAFVGWERRTRAPMLPLAYFGRPGFASGNAAGFFLVASLFSAVFLMSQYFQFALGHGPLEAGLRLLPWTGTVMVVSPIAGALADRIGERPFMIGGLLLQAGGMGWVALEAGPGTAYGSLVVPLFLSGCGVSMAFPAIQNAVVGSVPPAAIGTAAGTISTLRELGGVFGIAVVVAVFAADGGYGSPAAFADGFGPAIGVSALLAVIGATAALTLRGRQPAPAAPPRGRSPVEAQPRPAPARSS
jgi:EmrB/QacA subfamily drug resistance transporter